MLAVALMFVLAACGNGGGPTATDERTLNHFMQEFESNFDVEMLDAPFYSMLQAIGGVGFTANGSNVWIYEFSNIQAAEDAFGNFPMMQEQDWIRNGKFLLETNDAEAERFFTNIE